MSSDPWFWSVDQVVTQLCHSFALYLTAAQSAADIPDCPALEAELRMQNITGEALLKFDRSGLTIRNKLKIAHLNQRLALHAVVEVLQQRSHVYKLFQASTGATDATNSTEGLRNGTTAPRNGITEASPVIQKKKKVGNISKEQLRQVPPMQRMPGEPDEFNHLMRWQDTAEDDEIIDFAADDMGDGEYADWPDVNQAEDGIDILESDENDEVPTRCRLSKEEIYDVIDERINFYMDSWMPNAGVVPGDEVDYDVNAMWDKAEASGQRRNLVQKYEAEYEYFKLRLDKMREEIKDFPGTNANQIRQQCRNLEGTIESMELAGWLRDIYKLEPVADSDEELVHGDGELADHSDDAVCDADVETIDIDAPPKPAERSTPKTNNVTQDAAYIFGIPLEQQASTPKSRIAHSIDPTVKNHHQHSTHVIPNYGDEPDKASISSVRRWEWDELIEHLDRKRIVSKAIFEMNASDREAIRTRVRLIKKTSLLRELATCINMLKRGEAQLPGILPQDMRKIANFTNLFLSWWFCKNYFKEPNASVGDFEELQSCLDKSAGTTVFYDYLRTIMETTFSEQALEHPEQPSQAEIIEISDDD